VCDVKERYDPGVAAHPEGLLLSVRDRSPADEGTQCTLCAKRVSTEKRRFREGGGKS